MGEKSHGRSPEKFAGDDVLLIRNILRNRAPDLMPRFNDVKVDDLALADVDALVDVLSDELAASGIGPDGKINEQGLAAERLISILIRRRWQLDT